MEVPVVLGEHVAVELGHRARRFDARRAASHDDDIERTVLDEARILVRRLPALEHVFLEAYGIRQGVHREGVLGCALGPEEGHLRAKPEDEVVEGQWLHLLELNLPGREVDRRHRRLVDGRVVLTAHEIAQRVSDRTRLEQARGELIQERLEGVVVVLVDEHDVRRGVLQLVRSANAGEASAEDEDTRARVGGRGRHRTSRT